MIGFALMQKGKPMSDILKLIEKLKFIRDYECRTRDEINAMNDAITELSAQPDLSGYSDRLWKAAYERGKGEGRAVIVRCKDCAKREYCRTSTVWAVAPPDDWYCADAERREE